MTSSRKVRRVYLDHASATPVDPRVVRAMIPYLSREFGNPSAIYQEGVEAKKAVEAARTAVARLISARSSEIIFTSGATESLNLALKGAVAAWKKKHPGKIPEIIVSSIEHEAVLGAARALTREGTKIICVKPEPNGVVDAKKMLRRITPRTALVSLMYANNEIGTIQPVKEVGRGVKEWRSRRGKGGRYPLFHTDAVQAANYLPVHVESLSADLLTLGAGKIYGPKGVGLLYARRGTPLSPLLHGGGQEREIRPGTEAVPLIVGFSEALSIAVTVREKESARLTTLRDYFIRKLLSLPGVVLNGDAVRRLPNNVNISVKGIDNEFFIIALDERGIAASTKSACKQGSDEASHVILSLGKSEKEANESVRLTLGRSTRKHDLDYTVNVIKKLSTKNYQLKTTRYVRNKIRTKEF